MYEKQYILQFHSGYVESCSIASICLYRLVLRDSKVTAEELIRSFRETIREILPAVNEDRSYWDGGDISAGELFLHMMSTDNDQVGTVYELLEDEGWYLSPEQDCYFAGVISADNMDAFLDHEDDSWLPTIDLYELAKHEVKPSPLTEEEKALLDELPEEEDEVS